MSSSFHSFCLFFLLFFSLFFFLKRESIHNNCYYLRHREKERESICVRYNEMRWDEMNIIQELKFDQERNKKKKKKINPKPWKIFHHVISHEKKKTRAIWGGMGVDTSFFSRGKKKNLPSAEYKTAKNAKKK